MAIIEFDNVKKELKIRDSEKFDEKVEPVWLKYGCMIEGLSPIPIIRIMALVDRMYDLYGCLLSEDDMTIFFSIYDKIEFLYSEYTKSLSKYKMLNRQLLKKVIAEFDRHLTLYDGFSLLEKAIEGFHQNYPDETNENRVGILNADEQLKIFRSYVFRTYFDYIMKEIEV